MVITPDVRTLPSKKVGGVRYFELVAEPVQREILPVIRAKGWGYNGSIPGPTILVFQGEYVNIRVHNRLPEDTSIHWHGLDIPNSMDGVPDVEPTPRIKPGEYFDYQFQVINPPGTHLYHSHCDTARQEMKGLAGGLIILDPSESHIHKDYFIMLHEFKLEGLKIGELKAGKFEINPISHDFNFFTMNGRCFPYTTPIKIQQGEHIRIRLANSGSQAHPIHLHGQQFKVTASDGNSLSNYLAKNTILVASGETWDIEFTSHNPGRWPFHCHIPHHMSNNFTKGSGGMFTVVESS